jgi:hypothetical protein
VAFGMEMMGPQGTTPFPLVVTGNTLVCYLLPLSMPYLVLVNEALRRFRKDLRRGRSSPFTKREPRRPLD